MLKDILKEFIEKPRQCVFGKWLEEQDEETQELFKQVLVNRVPLAPLFKQLAKHELIPFQLTVFKSHLKGNCACRTS